MTEKSNSTIERLRKPISRLIAFMLILMALLTVPINFEDGVHEALEIFGYFLLLTAGLGRIWCSIYIAGRKDKILCTDGPYSICRNPLYLFSFIGVIGAFLAFQSILLTVMASAIYLLYYRFVIKSEEIRLLDIFKVSFSEYISTTPRFFPRFSSYQSSVAERITSTKVIERGLREAVWFFIAIALIDTIEVIHRQGFMILATLPF
ncbi:MAG: isoprenylcysteine carboxylmethyltransferase family protein [Verrucomicrobia bacterium]|nr:isoprenylcysteine carboxylmethyltransferase family protein [Verrucomicrobiota bacterium]